MPVPLGRCSASPLVSSYVTEGVDSLDNRLLALLRGHQVHLQAYVENRHQQVLREVEDALAEFAGRERGAPLSQPAVGGRFSVLDALNGKKPLANGRFSVLDALNGVQEQRGLSAAADAKAKAVEIDADKPVVIDEEKEDEAQRMDLQGMGLSMSRMASIEAVKIGVVGSLTLMTDHGAATTETFQDRIMVHLDAIMGFVVLCNTIVLGVENQWEGYKSSLVLGLHDDDTYWAHAKTWFLVFEHVFALIFIIEFLIRFSVTRLRYFLKLSNILDFALVVCSILDIYILRPMQNTMGDSDTNNLLFRFLRILKLMRVLRILRVFKLFSQLHSLVRTMQESAKALVCPLYVLGIVISMSGLLITQLATIFIRDEKRGLKDRRAVFDDYGSPTRAMYSMFQATLSGCWPAYANDLVEKVSAAYAMFWILYAGVVVFAMLSVIRALFLKDTLQAAANDKDRLLEQERKQQRESAAKLKHAFHMIDDSGDGTINREELHEFVKNPDMKAFLTLMGIDVSDADMIFNLLDEGDGEITCDEFLEGLPRLKGSARSIDLLAVQKHVSKQERILHDLRKGVADLTCLLAVCDAGFREACKPQPTGHEMNDDAVQRENSANWLAPPDPQVSVPVSTAATPRTSAKTS